MTKGELYQEHLHLAPFHSEESDFRDTLSKVLVIIHQLIKILTSIIHLRNQTCGYAY